VRAPSKRPGRRTLAIAASGASLVLGLAGWAGFARATDVRAPEGARLASLDVSGALDGELWAATRVIAQTWLDTPVTLLVEGDATERTRRELGARVDLDATLAAVARGGEISLVRGVDLERLRAAVQSLRAEHDRSPIMPGVDEHGRAVPGEEGRVIPAREAEDTLVRALETEAVLIELPVRALAVPEVPTLSVAQATYTHVLASRSTRYSMLEDQWGRMRNIVVSAAAIDGAVIAPGESVSFNRVVGERTIDRGYRPADEVMDGRLVEGIGGGVCQVAATLHAAAFLAGLDVLEHHPHTRGSRYIEIGLDAAVGWPSQDLVVRNPYTFPVRVRAQTGRGELTVSLLGAAEAPEVTYTTEIVERIAHGTEERVAGDDRPDDPGVDGLVVRRERVVTVRGVSRHEVRTLRYPAVAALGGDGGGVSP
jgi:vancomycin resistance protein YoaR